LHAFVLNLQQKSSDSGILGKVGGALGLGAGAAVLGSVLGKVCNLNVFVIFAPQKAFFAS